MTAEDLQLVLYTHWASDDSKYADERQRVQVATGLLLAAATGCRPCSMFDTASKTADISQAPENCEDDLEASDISFSKYLNDLETEGSDIPDDSDVEDEYEATSAKRSILYRHIAIHVARHPDSTRPNIIFAKITLMHTKGEDKRSQM